MAGLSYFNIYTTNEDVTTLIDRLLEGIHGKEYVSLVAWITKDSQKTLRTNPSS